jgi:hypothetical protein
MEVRMPRFLIEVSEPAFDRLSEDARLDRRSVKDQAAWLLERQLLGSDRASRVEPSMAPANEQPAALGVGA